MKGDYEWSWFCWEVCFGSRTGANSSAHRNNVSTLFSSSCFSMSGVPCFAWALGTDMWRRILWKPATHHEPAHGPYYPPGVLLQSRSLRWVDLKWEGCWSLGGCARGQMGQKLWRQWWVAGRWWKKHRWHRATGLAYKVCLCQWRRIGLLPNLACRQFGEEWGVFWLGLWTGTFSKHHRPQGAARGYWLHGKGRGPSRQRWGTQTHSKSSRCHARHDRQQTQSQPVFVSRHNSSFWTVWCHKGASFKSEVEREKRFRTPCAFWKNSLKDWHIIWCFSTLPPEPSLSTFFRCRVAGGEKFRLD